MLECESKDFPFLLVTVKPNLKEGAEQKSPADTSETESILSLNSMILQQDILNYFDENT